MAIHSNYRPKWGRKATGCSGERDQESGLTCGCKPGAVHVGFLSDLHVARVDLFLHLQGLDTTTPSGRAMFQMPGVFAEFERAILVDRTMAGLARARAQGKRLGRPATSDETDFPSPGASRHRHEHGSDRPRTRHRQERGAAGVSVGIVSKHADSNVVRYLNTWTSSRRKISAIR